MRTSIFVVDPKKPTILALATLFAWSTTASAGTPSDVLAVKPSSAAAVSESLLLSRGLGGVPETAAIEADYGALAFLNEGTFGAATLGQAKSDAVRLASSSDEIALAELKDGDSDASNTESKSNSTPSKNEITDTHYEALVNNTVGFGENVSGGQGTRICRVESLVDKGVGTLRDCATKGSTWVVFDVSGVIALESVIRIANNTTIDGRGADITISKNGLSTGNRENIMIHNVKISDVEGDGITIFNAKNIWINHVTVGDTSDGAIDIIDQSENVTVSWSHFKKQDKTLLIGNNNNKTDDERMTVTLHHNWFDRPVRNNPTVRFGKVHMFNNVLTEWSGDGVNSVYGAQVLLENNIFEPGDNKTAVRTTVPKWMEVPGYINARGNLALYDAQVDSSEAEKVFEASDLYSYRLDTASKDLKLVVKAHAGWQPARFFDGSAFAKESKAAN